ncbi:MAG: DUF433 domain-containing protein [Bryobacterales bacterium]|nr:DUF433 domain-containing protein [Bryobacterales bacterium]
MAGKHAGSISPTDLRRQPAYTLAEAARYARVPQSTLRHWVTGRSDQSMGRPQRSEPLISMDDPSGRYLSFLNLVEAHILNSIRRQHGVSLYKVRQALDYVKDTFQVARPLIAEAFQTDGVDLFVERFDELINASRKGQAAMKEILKIYLQRIERDPSGLPICLYPFTRESNLGPVTDSAPRVVVISPSVSFGRPSIAGTGIPVAAIYERYKAGDSILDLMQDFRLETSEVEEAIRSQAA